jgi:O-methyltransferase domain/Dimerisation domain
MRRVPLQPGGDMELEQEMDVAVTPEDILRIGSGFWASKALMSAVELGVFTELAQAGALELHELRFRLGLHRRGARDFLDTLVALGLLRRGVGGYRNTPESERFLDRRKRTYIGSVVLMAGERLYPSWGRLTQALQTGLPQSEAHGSGEYFGTLYSDPQKLRLFVQSMTAFSLRTGAALAVKFPWSRCQRIVDLGTAQGAVPVELALVHPHLSGYGFDLPAVQPLFEEYVRAHGLEERLQFVPGNFFEHPLPPADVYILGHLLHDWDLEGKRALLAKVHAALPAGGALLVYDTLIDDGRCQNAFALLMSLNMLLQTPGGSEYTARECAGWLQQAGFLVLRTEPLTGPDTLIVAIKQ